MGGPGTCAALMFTLHKAVSSCSGTLAVMLLTSRSLRVYELHIGRPTLSDEILEQFLTTLSRMTRLEGLSLPRGEDMLEAFPELVDAIALRSVAWRSKTRESPPTASYRRCSLVSPLSRSAGLTTNSSIVTLSQSDTLNGWINTRFPSCASGAGLWKSLLASSDSTSRSCQCTRRYTRSSGNSPSGVTTNPAPRSTFMRMSTSRSLSSCHATTEAIDGLLHEWHAANVRSQQEGERPRTWQHHEFYGTLAYSTSRRKLHHRPHPAHTPLPLCRSCSPRAPTTPGSRLRAARAPQDERHRHAARPPVARPGNAPVRTWRCTPGEPRRPV